MPAPPDSRRTALAEFLRSRRERISPDDVGLPSGGRRRTPGLRREEVAQLAGVGVTWYTWLEQGRRINASVQVLDALARTLRMDSQERWHLLQLADIAVVPPPPATTMPTPGVEAILRQLDPFPAVVASQRYDLLAYNRAYNHLVGDLDSVEPSERNQAWLFFTHPYWREVCTNRGPASRHLVNSLRAAMASHLDDPLWTSLVNRLREASPEFESLWNRHDVTSSALPAKDFHSPVGDLHLDASRLAIGADGLNRILVYSPRDDVTRTRLTRLVEHGESRVPVPVAGG